MDWSTLLAAAGIGLTAIIVSTLAGLKEIIIAWFQRSARKIKKDTYVQSIQRLAEFLEAFEGIQKLKEVQRSLIFHGHNCGGYPTPGKTYIVRAIHGWCTKEGKENPLTQYNFSLQVDGHYIRLLEDVIKTGISIQSFELMPADTKLRAHYDMEGIKYAQFHYLGLLDEELIFVSAGSYDGEFSAATKGKLQFEVERLRSIMGEN